MTTCRYCAGIDSECIDLVCLDPPFNSKRLYHAPLGSDAAGARFEDIWTMDSVKAEWTELQGAADPALHHTVVGAGLAAGESMQAYLVFMAPRLAEVWRVLKPNGSMYLAPLTTGRPSVHRRGGRPLSRPVSGPGSETHPVARPAPRADFRPAL